MVSNKTFQRKIMELDAMISGCDRTEHKKKALNMLDELSGVGADAIGREDIQQETENAFRNFVTTLVSCPCNAEKEAYIQEINKKMGEIEQLLKKIFE